MALDPNDLKNYKLLFPNSEIQDGIKKLAEKLNTDFKNKDVVVVSVLDGAVFFTVDLVRHLKFKSLRMEFVGVASYEGTGTTGKPVITKQLRQDIKGKDVLLIEDTLDTGLTLQFLQEELMKGNPNSLKTVILVEKVKEVRKAVVMVDYIVFENVKGWVTGYGFDIDGQYREKPDILVKKDTT